MAMLIHLKYTLGHQPYVSVRNSDENFQYWEIKLHEVVPRDDTITYNVLFVFSGLGCHYTHLTKAHCDTNENLRPCRIYLSDIKVIYYFLFQEFQSDIAENIKFNHLFIIEWTSFLFLSGHSGKAEIITGYGYLGRSTRHIQFIVFEGLNKCVT